MKDNTCTIPAIVQNEDIIELFKLVSIMLRIDINIINLKYENFIYEEIPEEKKNELIIYLDRLQKISDKDIIFILKGLAKSFEDDLQLCENIKAIKDE